MRNFYASVASDFRKIEHSARIFLFDENLILEYFLLLRSEEKFKLKIVMKMKPRLLLAEEITSLEGYDDFYSHFDFSLSVRPIMRNNKEKRMTYGCFFFQ